MKAILAMDMPENCDYCSLEYDIQGYWKANICRGCGRQNPERTEKPEWCPLKAMPEKMEVCGRYPQKDGVTPSYKIGWNACIDKVSEG